MEIELDSGTDLAVKRHAVSALSKLNIESLNEIEPHKLDWRALNAAEKVLKKEAGAVIDRLTDGCSEERAAEIETAYDGMRIALGEIDREKDTRSNLGNKGPRELIDIDTRRRPGCTTVIARGVDDGGLDDAEDEPTLLKPEQRFTTWAIAKGGQERRGLSLGRYLRSMVVGGGDEVERRALSEGSDSAGGYTVPADLSAELIDLLRAQSIAVQAGAVTVPLETNVNNVAKLASDPVPGWRLENGAVAESDPTFTNVSMTPQSLAVMCKVSREVIADSLNLGTELPRILAAALANELDRVALLGTGTAPEPEGVANMTGIGTTAHDALWTSRGPLSVARTGILTANAGPVSAIIMHPRDEGKQDAFIDSTGQPLQLAKGLDAIPLLTTTSIPIDGGVGSDESTIFVGNFKKLIIGIRQDIRIDISRELFAGNHQFGFYAHMRADIAASHAGAFHTITGVQG